MKKLLAASLFLLIAPFVALAYTSPGRPAGLVNDFAGILTTEQKATLEQTLLENEQSTGNEIAVVTVSSLSGDTVENYAVQLFKEWGIGKKGADNGALLLIAISDHKLRIEVGYGLEPVLTDAVSSQIIRNTITPLFKENKYYEGITAGVAQMITATKNEVLAPAASQKNPWWGDLELDFLLFWVGLSLLQWFLSMLARSRSWWMGGVVGALAGVLVMFFVAVVSGLIVMAVLVPLGLALDFFISREYAKSGESGRKPQWWAGGPWIGGGFGGRGGGGGFGGFGGGGSGGGGSSGSW